MIDFLYNPQGRISRKGYLVAFLTPYLFLSYIAAPMLGVPVVMLIGLFFLWPKNIAVPVKRLHDMGLSGIYQAGFIGLAILARIMAAKGMIAGMGGMEALQTMSMDEQLAAAEALTQDGGNADLRTGALMVLGVEMAQVLFFGLVKGQSGTNQYGNDPLTDGRGFAD